MQVGCLLGCYATEGADTSKIGLCPPEETRASLHAAVWLVDIIPEAMGLTTVTGVLIFDNNKSMSRVAAYRESAVAHVSRIVTKSAVMCQRHCTRWGMSMTERHADNRQQR